MADREQSDNRFGESTYGGGKRDDDRSREERRGEGRSWSDDQGSGYNRDLYRGDNEGYGRNDERSRQGEPTYANSGSDSARRSQYRQDQRYEDTGSAARTAGADDDRRLTQRYQDDYGMGRRDYSRFEPRGEGRDRGQDWSLQSGQRGGAGASLGSSGQGGYGAGGFGRGGGGQSGYGGDYGQRQQGQDQGGTRYPGQQYGQSGYAGAGSGAHQQHGGDHDLEPDYRSWREQRLADYDRDYSHWREHQSRKHDDEYRSWRDQRRGQFHNEFEGWRSGRASEQGRGAQAQSGENDPHHGVGIGQGASLGGQLPENARPGAPSREATWSAGAGGGTGQGRNEGGGSMAQGLPNGGIAPGGGHYGEEYPTSGVTSAGGWNAPTSDQRPGEVNVPGSGAASSTSGSTSQASAGTATGSGVSAAVGDNTALHNMAQGKSGSADKTDKTDESKRDEDKASD